MNIAEKNALAALYLLLKLNGFNPSEYEINDLCFKNPYFPSLLSLKDVLYKIGIEPNVSKINLLDFMRYKSLPVITYVTKDGGKFIIIKSVNKNYVYWTYPDRGDYETKIDEFLEFWSEIVLSIDTVGHKVDLFHNYISGLKKNIFAYSIIILLIIKILAKEINSGLFITLVVINICNFFITIGLIFEEINYKVNQLYNLHTDVLKSLANGHSIYKKQIWGPLLFFCSAINVWFCFIPNNSVEFFFLLLLINAIIFCLVLMFYDNVKFVSIKQPKHTAKFIVFVHAITNIILYKMNLSSSQMSIYDKSFLAFIYLLNAFLLTKKINKIFSSEIIHKKVASLKFAKSNVSNIMNSVRTMAPIFDDMRVYSSNNEYFEDTLTVVIDPRFNDNESVLNEQSFKTSISLLLYFSYA